MKNTCRYYLYINYKCFYAASEKVYLKCKKIVTENKTKGYLKDMTVEGNFVQIVLIEIIIAKNLQKLLFMNLFLILIVIKIVLILKSQMLQSQNEKR